MKKKLLFYFYITPDFFEQITNLIHLECLRYYAHIFDEALFVLSTNDVNDRATINSVEKVLINLPFNGNVSFKIHKNDEFRESIVLKEELFDRLKDENALVFFGHGKGLTNLDRYAKEDIFHWIAGAYYLSLNFIDEVLNYITCQNLCWVSYGSFPIYNKEKRNIEDAFKDISTSSYLASIKYQWIYSGTFFWTNPKKLQQLINNFEIELPLLDNRYYSEKILGNIIPLNNYAASHYNMRLFGDKNPTMYDPHVSRDFIKFITHTEEEYNDYLSFYDKIMYPLISHNNRDEKEKLIEIVYAATNGYCNYAKGFFDSLKYFMPGIKKTVTILSNGLSEYEGYCEGDVISTKVVKMFDLIYPCINLHKNYFLEQLPHDNVDYIFYFDADTVFKEVPDYDWNKMIKDLDENKVLISKHPMYAAKESFDLYGVSKKDWIDNFFTSNVTEKNSTRHSYIPYEKYTYVISSFFAANVQIMHNLNEKIIALTREDLTRYYGYHIPSYIDENYFNKLTSDYEHNINHGIDFSIEQYSELYNSDSEYYDNVFIYQKNFPDHKTNRR